MRALLILLLLSASLFACKSKSAKEPAKQDIVPDTVAVIDPKRDSILLQLTSEVFTAFKNKDYNALAAMVHPEEGVRFSPYAYIDTAKDKKLSAAVIKEQADSNKQPVILWGTSDPADEPIRKTINSYVKDFVYDVDFLHPEKVKVNEFIGGGNTLNNLLAVYTGCDFTESHFSGFDKKFEGMDWRSLRLVFKLKDGKYFLVGVVHDAWST